MADSSDGPVDDATEAARVATLYDRWSRHPRALDILYAVATLGREASLRSRAVAALDPTPGDRVLEVGCGTGNSFPALCDRLGEDGTLVGLDASRGMVRAARERSREAGPPNAHVVRGDARRPPVRPGTVDGAYAAMSLSAVPDPAGAIRAVARALRPGGRFVVLDARPFRGWPWRALNRVVVPVAAALTGWVPGVDLVAVLRREFETVEVSTVNAGSLFVARAETSPAD